MSYGVSPCIGTPLDAHLSDQLAKIGTDHVPYVRAATAKKKKRPRPV